MPTVRESISKHMQETGEPIEAFLNRIHKEVYGYHPYQEHLTLEVSAFNRKGEIPDYVTRLYIDLARRQYDLPLGGHHDRHAY